MIPLSQVSESFLFKVHTHNAIAGPLEEICIQIAVIYVSSSSTKPLFQTVTSDGILKIYVFYVGVDATVEIKLLWNLIESRPGS